MHWSGFSEIALVPIYFDQFASRIVNPDHSIMRAAGVLRIFDGVADF